MGRILIGNAFPLALMRRKVTIEPMHLDDLRAAIENQSICSFWGHENTLEYACQLTGIDLRPHCERPIIHISSDGYPMLCDNVFTCCWIVSPNFKDHYRPSIGEEAPEDLIDSWEILRLRWE